MTAVLRIGPSVRCSHISKIWSSEVQCFRRGLYMRDGQVFCGQHDPLKIRCDFIGPTSRGTSTECLKLARHASGGKYWCIHHYPPFVSSNYGIREFHLLVQGKQDVMNNAHYELGVEASVLLPMSGILARHCSSSEYYDLLAVRNLIHQWKLHKDSVNKRDYQVHIRTQMLELEGRTRAFGAFVADIAGESLELRRYLTFVEPETKVLCNLYQEAAKARKRYEPFIGFNTVEQPKN